MTFLPPAAVQRLTKRKRFSAQRRALDRLKIPYRQATDGEPLVREADLDGASKPAQRRAPGHRWHMIGSIRNLRP